MKAVILAGGFGTRISEETGIRPKPMVEIGSKPILWHIMKLYSAYGINDFIICTGYKGEVILDYFANYYLRSAADVTFDIAKNSIEVHRTNIDPWRVTIVDTGAQTMTGGRIKRIREYIGHETFCMTYGDGVSDIDISELIRFHCSQNVLVTLTAVKPPGRFGAFSLNDGDSFIKKFKEKAGDDNAWINGGFFVMEPEVMDYIDGDETIWEREPLETIATTGKLAAYRHFGFWQNMDTLRDKSILEKLWQGENPPWKVWSS